MRVWVVLAGILVAGHALGQGGVDNYIDPDAPLSLRFKQSDTESDGYYSPISSEHQRAAEYFHKKGLDESSAFGAGAALAIHQESECAKYANNILHGIYVSESVAIIESKLLCLNQTVQKGTYIDKKDYILYLPSPGEDFLSPTTGMGARFSLLILPTLWSYKAYNSNTILILSEEKLPIAVYSGIQSDKIDTQYVAYATKKSPVIVTYNGEIFRIPTYSIEKYDSPFVTNP